MPRGMRVRSPWLGPRQVSSSACFLLLLVLRSWLSSSTSFYSGRVVVLFPSNFTSGGPACLHALHTTLLEQGIASHMFAINPLYEGQYGHRLEPLVDNQTGEPFPSGSEAEIQSALPAVMNQLNRNLTPRDVLNLPMKYNDYVPRKNLTALLNRTGARSAGIRSALSQISRRAFMQQSARAHCGLQLRIVTQGLSQILPLSNFIHGFHGLPHSSRSSVLLSPMEPVYYQHAEVAGGILL